MVHANKESPSLVSVHNDPKNNTVWAAAAILPKQVALIHCHPDSQRTVLKCMPKAGAETQWMCRSIGLFPMLSEQYITIYTKFKYSVKERSSLSCSVMVHKQEIITQAKSTAGIFKAAFLQTLRSHSPPQVRKTSCASTYPCAVSPVVAKIQEGPNQQRLQAHDTYWRPYWTWVATWQDSM